MVVAATRIRLKVAADGMTVTADVTPGAPAGITDLRAALAAARVVYMVDQTGVTQLAASLSDPKFSTVGKIIAHGQDAMPGKDGFFEPAFHVGIQPGHVGADGKIDFFDRELLKPVVDGAYVGTLHKPQPGRPGRRVDGGELKIAAVQPSKLRVGPGLRVDGSGRLYAAHAGALLYIAEQTIDVAAQHVHRGDVDMRSGSLEMEGALVVGGTVQRLFIARASGELEIQGGVDSGSAYSSANIKIHGGVRGGDSGMVCAQGSITARYAEAAHIICGGLLKLESAVNCELAASKIEVTRTIRGGTAQAETSLVVQQAGAPSGGATTLCAGHPLDRSLLDVRRAINAAKEQRVLQHRGGGLRGDGERSKGGKIGRDQAGLVGHEVAGKARFAERRAELLSTAQVQIAGRAYPGVLIQIGVHSLLLEDSVSNARFVFDPQKRIIHMDKGLR
jgi:uncharacterized protein (DUF342 family)